MSCVWKIFKSSSAAIKIQNLPICKRFSTTSQLYEKEKCQILIVGGGSGGCSLAAKLCRQLGNGKVTVLEPADLHYYQPMFTLIGGGMKKIENSYKSMSKVLPKNVKWIKEKAVHFDPKNNTVLTDKDRQINYDILVLALGLQLNYDKIPGLIDALSIKNGNVSSIYSPKYVNRTFETFKNFDKGNAIFTFPASPVKCPGAPQKICYIFDDYLRRKNKRENANITYNTSLPTIFGVKYYADALWNLVKKRNIEVNVRRNLIEVKPNSNTAIFENLDNPDEKFEINYSLLHVVPPMGPPNELKACSDLVDSAGFVNVNPDYLQHNNFKNVYAIGDCSASPNSKTAAAVAAQCPIVFNAIIENLKGNPYKGNSYDGYASCPLVTGYNRCILAEFDYKLNPLETFPVSQNKERYSMFFMKKNIMPSLYWNLMLNGYWNGPGLMRKIFSPFKFS